MRLACYTSRLPIQRGFPLVQPCTEDDSRDSDMLLDYMTDDEMMTSFFVPTGGAPGSLQGVHEGDFRVS